MRSFFTAMSIAKAKIKKERDRSAGQVYKDLAAFVESGVYTSYKGISTLATVYLNGGKDKDVAVALGVTEPTVRVHKSNISNQLYTLFGEDFFSLLDDFSANEDEIYRRLKIASVKSISPSDVLDVEILAHLGKLNDKKDQSRDYKLGECTNEIRFLNLYNKKAVQKELEGLDKKKLRYILDVLDGRAGTPAEKYQLITTELELGD